MNFKLVKNERLSGKEASIYEVYLEGATSSVFDQFLNKYRSSHRKQVNSIIDRLEDIGDLYGARSDFFKDKEGKYGDLVEALFDTPDKKLRLYCIRFGKDCVILGGGAPKPKGVRAWQDDTELTEQAELMIDVAAKVHQRFEDGDMKWSRNYLDLEGDLVFKEEDDE